MKNTSTYLTLAATGLLFALVAQANKGAEYKPHHKHHEGRKFTLTGGATYLEPSTNLLDYVTYETSPTGGGFSAYSETVEPAFSWGYYLAAAYRISHHYDIQASWAQFNTSLSDSFGVTGEAGSVQFLNTSSQAYSDNIAISPGHVASAHSKQNIDYSVFDANLGQYHNITEMLRARLFAGIRYAKITADIDNDYFGFFPPANTFPHIFDYYDSSYSGVGPELGIDVEYEVYHQLGVVASVLGALLVGPQESQSVVYNQDFSPAFEVLLDSDTVTRIVPAVDLKLGLNWDVPFNHQHFAFGIEGGYQASFYLNAIDQTYLTRNSDVVEHNYSNYGNMGPYLNLSAMF